MIDSSLGTLALVTALAAAVPARPSSAAFAQDPALDVSAQLEAIRSEHGVPALAAALLHAGRVTAIGASGVRALKTDARVTPDDLWHIGSCTKAMTATAIARLVEREVLRWEQTLAEVFGDWAESMHADYRGVTLRQLVDHCAGLPRDFDLIARYVATGKEGPQIAAGRRAALAKILAREPATPVGQRVYSNVGFVLAGHVLEQVTGETWESVMRAEVFTPLGMESAGFGTPGETDELSQPWGHTTAKVAGNPHEPGSDLPAFYGPAGLVHVSLRDWAKFVALHIEGARGTSELLQPATLRAMHAPVADGLGYACGWVVTERDWASGTVLAHSGSNLRWFAVVWMSPADDFAVLATCNMGPQVGAKACDAAASMLIARHRKAVSDVRGERK